MKRKSLLAIVIFLIMTILPMISLAILPVQCIYGDQISVYIVNIVWFFVVIIGFFCVLRKHAVIKIGKGSTIPVKKRQFKFVFLILSFISIMGIIFLLIDRIYIRKLDYSAGFRAARYEWLKSSLEGRGGSFFSVVGNLCNPFSYVILFLTLFHWEKLDKKLRFLGILSGYGVPFVLAMLNGGRSQLLVMLIYSVAVLVMRYADNKTIIPKLKHKYAVGTLLMAACVGVVFYMKSLFFAFEKDTSVATRNLLELLGGEYAKGYQGENSLVNLLISMITYLFHGQWITTLIMKTPIGQRGGEATFYIFLSYLEKFHIIDNVQDRTLAPGGVFLTLQGSLYYDYGYLGIIVGGLFFGALLGYAVKLMDKKSSALSFVQILYVITIFVIMFGTSITPMYGLGGYVFIIYAMIVTDIVVKILFGKVSWTLIEEEEL